MVSPRRRYTGSMRFERTYRVRFSHCDVAGIVFYPQYFVLFNDHLEEWFEEACGVGFEALHRQQGLGVPTAHLETDFRAPSRIGDRLVLSLGIAHLGNSALALDRNAHCGGQLRVSLRQRIVCIDLADGRPRPWPAPLRERMMAFASS